MPLHLVRNNQPFLFLSHFIILKMVNFPRQARDKHMRKALKEAICSFACRESPSLARDVVSRITKNICNLYEQPQVRKTGLVGHFGPLCGKTGSGQT